MHYTTQQLQGGPKYSHKTRIGNWKEDMELEEIKTIDFNGKKENSQLNFHKTLSKCESSYKKVPWSFSADGKVRYGNSVMITNKQVKGWMVVDIGNRVSYQEEAFVLTTTQRSPGPITRSIFVIKKTEDVDTFGNDEFVRYGQKIRIEINPHLYKKPLYLSSTPLGPQVYSPVTRKQEACLSARQNYQCTWIIDYIDPNYRFEKQGEIVTFSDPILIRHAATSNYLASDLNKIGNDFGNEYEVCVHNFCTKNRSQNLALEKDGKTTGDIPSKFQDPQNIFFLLCSPDPSYATPIEELNKFTIEDLINQIKAKIIERSANGIRGIAKIFRAMDENKNRKLDVDDFRWGLMDYGITITKDEATQVLQAFDRDGNGVVDYDEFLRAIRGDLNQVRIKYIRMAYDKLDVTRDGRVKLDDIQKLYDASHHPDVVNGKKSKDQVFKEFLNLWDTRDKDGIITFEEFCDYYKDISASIDTDEYFATMMINAYKLKK